ncbi:MAG: MBL fold metallo-hydrolase [Gammaproteobacteria bacterium]|nr:MBL fold metallo-hydrolase [Gammaproteobacteria bacterium]
MAVSNIRQWQVGDVKVTRIVEVNSFVDDIGMLFAGSDAEWLKQYDWLIPTFTTPEGMMIISFQAFVVETPSHRIMIDTCIGSDRQRQFDVFSNMQSDFLDDLIAAGYPPESIDTVFCTHMHFDHVGWNTQLVDGKWVPTFPNARYLVARTEFESMQRLRAEGDTHYNHFDDAIKPVIDAGLMTLIEVGDSLCDEVTLEHTPGHTEGHCSVRIDSKGISAIITGDIMHHPVQITVPEKEANFDLEKTRAGQTRKDFVKRYIDQDVLVIGSHFCEPTAGHVVTSEGQPRFRELKD